MAITIETAAPSPSPVYNPMNFVVSSTNSGNSNFSYLAEVYVYNGATYDKVGGTVKFPKRGASSYGVFDPSGILRNYVNDSGFDIDFTDIHIEECDNMHVYYYVDFGEEYTSGGSITQFTSLTASSSLHAWNGVLEFTALPSYAKTTYAINSATTPQFLTNMPDREIEIDEEFYLYGTCHNANEASDIRIRTYDSTGAQNGEFKINYDGAALTNPNDRWIRTQAGAGNINDIDAGDITTVSGATPIIDSDVGSYDICWLDSLGNVSSEVKTFTIVDKCSKHTEYDIYFLNRLGGIDQFRFRGKTTESHDITRNNYLTNPYTLSGTSYSYAATDSQRKVTKIDYNDKLTLSSDWIPDGQANWLEELFTSPNVWIKSGNDLYPITVSNSSYTNKKYINDTLWNITLEVQYSYMNHTQIN